MNAKLLSETFDARPGQATVADEYPEAVAAEPADALPAVENEHSTLGLVELLLKNPQRADTLNREERRQAELIPREWQGWLLVPLLASIYGFCQTPCTGDGDCQGGGTLTHCVSGRCQVACLADQTCPAGYICNGTPASCGSLWR